MLQRLHFARYLSFGFLYLSVALIRCLSSYLGWIKWWLECTTTCVLTKSYSRRKSWQGWTNIWKLTTWFTETTLTNNIGATNIVAFRATIRCGSIIEINAVHNCFVQTWRLQKLLPLFLFNTQLLMLVSDDKAWLKWTHKLSSFSSLPLIKTTVLPVAKVNNTNSH